jgi:hypothetical protein
MDDSPKYPATRETAITVSGSTTRCERLQLADAPELEQFNSDASLGVRRHVQSPDTDQLKTSEPARPTMNEVLFGPFRLLPASFFCWKATNGCLSGVALCIYSWSCLNGRASWSPGKS